MLSHSADNGNGDPLFSSASTGRSGSSSSSRCWSPSWRCWWPGADDLVRAQGHLGHAEPDRAEPGRALGLLQTLADGTKLFFKEDLLPERADRFVFKLAPYLAVIPALLIFTIVPVGGVVTIARHTFELQVADPPIGILFLLAMSGIAVYGVMLAGWSSGSKYPLLGSVRGLGPDDLLRGGARPHHDHRRAGAAHALDPGDRGLPGDGFWHWNLIRLGFVPFIFFLIAITAELNRPPFDLTEAEYELVGGFHTEYSSIRFALFFLAEFMNTITMSAIVVTLFFGGPDGSGFHIPGAAVCRSSGSSARPRVLLHLRLVPRRAAPAALRPADGPRLEAADPDLARPGC